jgi:hypothetical protein
MHTESDGGYPLKVATMKIGETDLMETGCESGCSMEMAQDHIIWWSLV